MRIGIITDLIDKEYSDNQSSKSHKIVTENLVKNILKIDKKNEYYLIHSQKSNHPIYKLGAKEIIIPANKLKLFKLYRKLFIINNLIKKYKLELVHEPSPILPIISGTHFIATVHDIIPLLFPKIVSTRLKIYFQLFFKYQVKRASHLIAVSNYTKNDIIKFLKIPKHKISVVYNGVDKQYKLLNKSLCKKFLQKKYKIPKNFLLYVGTLDPRKNVRLILLAFEKLKRHFPLLKLVIVGKNDWKNYEIVKIIKQLGIQDKVIFTGFVPDEELPSFYNSAAVFVFPSLYEGFGLPPLEAMACGCPVITSNTSSLPEVVGDAGIMVNPHDIKGLANAIEKVLTNKKLRQQMIKNGLKQAKKFSWEKCAKETLKVYEKVLKNP